MHAIKPVLLGLASIILAYLIIVIFSVIFQDALFGGLTYPESPWHHLLIGGSGTVVGAVVGGYVMSLVTRGQYRIPAILIGIWILVEAVYLTTSGVSTSPLWFDVLAASSLVVGIWFGCIIRNRQQSVRSHVGN